MKISIESISNIVILTGAGISQESGIKTFRDSGGLWEGHAVEEVASPLGYASNPKLVQNFYNLRRKQLFEVEPNAAHTSLAKLEREFPGNVNIITQNVDDLHSRAGSKNVLHMHGELRKIRNTKTSEVKYFEDDISENDYEKWRPDIVWFGEGIKGANQIHILFNKCDLFLSIGTSGKVYPAAGFVDMCNKNNIPTIELNLEKTSKNFQESIEGKASEIVPQFVDSLLKIHQH